MTSQWIRDWKAGALDIAEKRARAKARMVALEAAAKDSVSESYRTLRSRGKTQGDAEREARLDPTCKEAHRLWAEAIQEYEQLNSKLNLEMAALEAWRTQQATIRQEMSLR